MEEGGLLLVLAQWAMVAMGSIMISLVVIEAPFSFFGKNRLPMRPWKWASEIFAGTTSIMFSYMCLRPGAGSLLLAISVALILGCVMMDRKARVRKPPHE